MRSYIKKVLLGLSPSYRKQVYMTGIVEELSEKLKTHDGMLTSLLQRDEVVNKQLQILTEAINKVSVDFKGTERLMKLGMDIEALPQSKGALRDIQEISFKMLCEVDRICKKHDLQYWLDFGTLLGGVRHKGFIPWDDDMDISMVNNDYEKLLLVIDEELKNTDFRFIRVPSQIGKVVHKDFMPHGEEEITKFIHWELEGKLCFALDIFPYYYAKDELSDDSLCNYLKDATSDSTGIFHGEHMYDDFNKAEKEVSKHVKYLSSSTTTKRLFLGPQTMVYQPRIAEASEIFPLTKIEFEGGQFPAPCHVDPYLVGYYGDYMLLPENPHTHLHFDTIPKEDIKRLKELRQRNG